MRHLQDPFCVLNSEQTNKASFLKNTYKHETGKYSLHGFILRFMCRSKEGSIRLRNRFSCLLGNLLYQCRIFFVTLFDYRQRRYEKATG